MALTPPKPGQVICYSYLWKQEANAGAEEGRKDRPCAVVLTTKSTATDDVIVSVAPITHTPPSDESVAVEIPASTKRSLGLDDERSWIVINEVNIFRWPGPDIRPVPGSKPSRISYGFLGRGLYETVRTKMVTLIKQHLVGTVKRTE